MSTKPVPVVMLSSQTAKNTMATLEALALGAVDYITKPQTITPQSMAVMREEIVNKLKFAISATPQPRQLGAIKQPAPNHSIQSHDTFKANAPRRESNGGHYSLSHSQLPAEGLVVLGASTGGPGIVEEIVSAIPADFCFPVVVVQHMPASFTTAFAQRLDQICPLHVVEVTRMTQLQAGHIYIAQGGHDAEIVRRFGKLSMTPRTEDSRYIWHPSVDCLAASLLKVLSPKQIIAVLLTGMGNDGARTFAQIHQQGGMTIAQSESSCVVFGMPKELIALDGAGLVLDPDKMKTKILHASRMLQRSLSNPQAESPKPEGRS